MPTDDPWADRHLDLTDAEFDRIIADGPVFAHATGDAFEYSNFGYALLGRVVHRATGQTLQRIITDQLLGPLGMNRSTWVRPDHDDWARPQQWLDGAFTDELPPLGDGLIAPMGGIWTTVTDLATWITWLDDAFPSSDAPDVGPLRRRHAARCRARSATRACGRSGVCVRRSATATGCRWPTRRRSARSSPTPAGCPGTVQHAVAPWPTGRRRRPLQRDLCTDVRADGAAPRRTRRPRLVPKAVIPVSAAVASATERLIALLNDWDDDASNELCTRSFALDEPVERRRARRRS